MIEQKIIGFTMEQIENLALDNGWTRTVMTTDLSPNVSIENPQTALQFLDKKFNEPLREAIKEYRLKEAKALADSKIAEAQAELKAIEEADKPFIDNLIQVTVSDAPVGENITE